MDTPAVTEPTITVKDAAKFWGVPESTVYTWVHRYKVGPVGQVGRALLYRFADMAAAERRARNQPGGRPRGPILKFDWQT